jgi:uncharacterized protein
MKKLLSMLVLGGLAVAAPAVPGEPAGVLKVEDKAGLFTPEGVKQAERRFAEGAFQGPVHLTVVTVNDAHVPAALKKDFEAARKDPSLVARVFSDWAHQASAGTEPGVFALLYAQGRENYVRVLSSRDTDRQRGFTPEDTRKLADVFLEGLRTARDQPEAEAKATRDKALLGGVEFVAAQLKDTAAPAPGARGGERTDEAAGAERTSGGGWLTSIGSLCCCAIVAVLGIWLIVGLIRAFSGGGGGPGGGGGGFFPSLLGGLFGAAAGMYLYDTFFGGSSAAAADPGAAGDAGDAGAADAGPDTYDGGAESGGGDFGGGDFGGGDFGGGDFGGD